MRTNFVRDLSGRTAIAVVVLLIFAIAGPVISFGPGGVLVREAQAKPTVTWGICFEANNTCENCSYSNPPRTTWCFNTADEYWGECVDLGLAFLCEQSSSACNNLYTCASPPVDTGGPCGGNGGSFAHCTN